MRRTVRGMLLIAACVTLWSFTGLLTKAIPWSGVAIAGWRGLIASAVLYAYMRARRIPFARGKRTWYIGVCVAGAAVSCLVANKYTAAANVVMLQYTAPVWLILLSILFFKRKYGAFDYCVVGVTLLGILLFFLDELTPGNVLGNICALLCGLTYGGTYLFSEDADMRERLSGILLGFVLTGLVGAPFLFFTPCDVTPKSVLMVVLMGAVFYALPYALYAESLKDCPALAAILISAIEIVLNPVWVYLFLHEVPGPWAFVGSGVILSAILIYSVHNARVSAAKKSAAQVEEAKA